MEFYSHQVLKGLRVRENFIGTENTKTLQVGTNLGSVEILEIKITGKKMATNSSEISWDSKWKNVQVEPEKNTELPKLSSNAG